MAIAFDNVLSVMRTAVTVTSDSVAYTCTGVNRYLLVPILTVNNTITGVTYNGVSMTLLKSQLTGGTSPETILVYGLSNPASGSNTLQVNASPADIFVWGAISYTGVNQVTSPIDASTSQQGAGQSSPYTTTLSTTADNCWSFLYMRSQALATSAGSGSTFRGSDSGADGRNNCFYDSNGALTPAGSHSMGVTFSGTQTIATIMIALAPPGSVGGVTLPYRSLLGVGI